MVSCHSFGAPNSSEAFGSIVRKKWEVDKEVEGENKDCYLSY